MKIVHLIHHFPPEFRGGTELYLLALCKVQIAAGHEVTVISGSAKRDWLDDFVEDEHEGIRVLRFLRLPQGEEYSADFYLERFETIYLEFLEREKPDLMHLHHWMNLGNEVVRAAADMGIVTIITLHDLYPLCPRFFMTRPDGSRCEPGALPLERCIECLEPEYDALLENLEDELRIRKQSFISEMTAAGCIISPSNSHAKAFVDVGLLSVDQITVIGHGLVRQIEGAVCKPSPKGSLRIGTWGNFVRAKGIHVLLSAFREARVKLGDRIELHLYGKIIDADLEVKLKTASKDDGVVFHGDLTDFSLQDMGSGLDLVVFPSLARESYSMVLDEAAALGLPVVVSDSGALPERVGDGGVVVEAGSVEKLTEVMIELEGDRERLKRMSEAIKDQKWTVNDNSRRLDEVYEQALRKKVLPVPNQAQLKRTALYKGRISVLSHERDERDGAFVRFSRFREFVPLREFDEITKGEIVVLAPHPDDEVIGCGGVIAMHAARGDRVTVVHLTDGSGGGNGLHDGKTLAEVRKSEASAAGRILGTQRFISLDMKDGQLMPEKTAIEKVFDLVRTLSPNVVYAPSPFEIHQDHMATLFIALHILDRYSPGFDLLLYEVNEVMIPGYLIDVTGVIEKKDRALACFESQILQNDVREKSMAGARWRTANIDLPLVTHAEAFIETDARSIRGVISRTKELVKYIASGGADDR